MTLVRMAWIGCGTHANEMLLPQLMRHDVTLTALCDTDAGRLARTAARFGVPPERTTCTARASPWTARASEPPA